MKQIQDYLTSQEVQSKSDATQTLYAHVLTTFDAFMGGDARGENYKINSTNLMNFCLYLEQNKKSAGTIQQYINIIKTMLRRTGTPVEFTYHIPTSAKKQQQEKNLERWFTESEVKKILAYKGWKEDLLRNSILIRLLFETGARVNEIATLVKDDFENDERTVWIRESKTTPRPAFYSHQTQDLLKQYLKSLDRDTGLFPQVQQCKRIFSDMLLDLGMKNGADGRGPHTARHFCATHLYYVAKMDLTDIAVLLGDKVETIRENYLHPTADMLRSRMDSAMGGGYGWY